MKFANTAGKIQKINDDSRAQQYDDVFSHYAGKKN